MDKRELIGKRLENEHGRIGTITAVSQSGLFVLVEFPHGYYPDTDDVVSATIRVEDLIPNVTLPEERRVWVKGHRNRDVS